MPVKMVSETEFDCSDSCLKDISDMNFEHVPTCSWEKGIKQIFTIHDLPKFWIILADAVSGPNSDEVYEFHD